MFIVTASSREYPVSRCPAGLNDVKRPSKSVMKIKSEAFSKMP